MNSIIRSNFIIIVTVMYDIIMNSDINATHYKVDLNLTHPQ